MFGTTEWLKLDDYRMFTWWLQTHVQHLPAAVNEYEPKKLGEKQYTVQSKI